MPKKTSPKEPTFVKVTTEELYAFEPKYSNNWPISKIIEEWFTNFPINTSHAARDNAQVGHSKRITNIQILSDKDAEDYIKKLKSP